MSIKPKYDLRLFTKLCELYYNCTSQQFMYKTCTIHVNYRIIYCHFLVDMTRFCIILIRNNLYRNRNTYKFIRFCLQDLTDDLSAVQTRWLSSSQASSKNLDPKTPDIEAMDMDTYSKSIYNMNDSLHDLHR